MTRTLADYRPQHDEDCAKAKCAHIYEGPLVSCTCGLNTLLARSGEGTQPMTPTECLTELETRITARFTPSLNTASALEALILVAETIREMKAEVEAQPRSGEGATPPTLNINTFVSVRLTSKGHEIIKTPVEEVDGWSRWQLWELFQVFGPHLYLGCEPPFEMTIRLQPVEGATPPQVEPGDEIASAREAVMVAANKLTSMWEATKANGW